MVPLLEEIKANISLLRSGRIVPVPGLPGSPRQYRGRGYKAEGARPEPWARVGGAGMRSVNWTRLVLTTDAWNPAGEGLRAWVQLMAVCLGPTSARACFASGVFRDFLDKYKHKKSCLSKTRQNL